MSQSPLSEATDDRLSEMLFQGEEVEDEFTVEGARVAVTTHRVLVFTPDGDGRRFDHADRPNVLDANVETTGQDSYVEWGVRTGVYGAVLFGGGFLLKTSGILDQLGAANPPENTPETGVTELVSLLPKALGTLTTGLLVGGALLVLAALALVALYLSSRERELVIERAGDDPMRVPVRDDDAEDVARRLRAAVGTGSKPRSD
ncbi:hypothetical protein [Halorussus sp. MSC15.2]|uniref:hypothetical protein n=1 Tax=Halorussus sp. MSC15.2 TaxID=2283638 RepID=UPI0013D5C64F|nr:hypothetical protein [Halorussus sp. MSC15.2]NEU58366.1 hypothetical protein [Halorussus sp. MSC15.2]